MPLQVDPVSPMTDTRFERPEPSTQPLPGAYENEEECITALFHAKWPDGFKCLRCGHGHAYRITTRRLPLFECSGCRTQSSLIAGTIMERSRTPLRVWFKAIELLAGGMNALQLSQVIGVTYKTAWLISHKIRKAMSAAELADPLDGHVRAAYFLIHRRLVPSFDLHRQEQPCIIGAAGDKNGSITRIRLEKQKKTSNLTRFSSLYLTPFMKRHLASGAKDIRPVSQGMWHMGDANLLRITTDAENWLAWTFGGIGPKHLQRYLDQFCYIWNRSDQTDWSPLIRHCGMTAAITYPQLVGKHTRSSRQRAISSQRKPRVG